MTSEFQPPYVPLSGVSSALQTGGFALLHAADVQRWLPASPTELDALHAGWNDLPPDAYLKDGGRYRRRRHSCFVVDGAEVSAVPHRAHWQPLEYNALHGGMQRWFEPMQPELLALPVWGRLLSQVGEAVSELRGRQPWIVEAHSFRIDTTELDALHAGWNDLPPDAYPRPRVRTATVWTWWRCSCWGATASRAVRAGCLRPMARTASASRCRNPGRCCCWTTSA
jgi:hypothetical protein